MGVFSAQYLNLSTLGHQHARQRTSQPPCQPGRRQIAVPSAHVRVLIIHGGPFVLASALLALEVCQPAVIAGQVGQADCLLCHSRASSEQARASSEQARGMQAVGRIKPAHEPAGSLGRKLSLALLRNTSPQQRVIETGRTGGSPAPIATTVAFAGTRSPFSSRSPK